jgi:PhnB protein
MMTRFKDMAMPDFPIPEHEADKIMHIALPIGKGSILRGSDTPQSLGRHNETETRTKMYISFDSKEKADRLFKGLSEDGQIEMLIADSPWGSYLGMFRDKFGF